MKISANYITHSSIGIWSKKQVLSYISIILLMTILALLQGDSRAVYVFIAIQAIGVLASREKTGSISVFSIITICYFFAFPFTELVPSLSSNLLRSIWVNDLRYGLDWAYLGFSSMLLGYLTGSSIRTTSNKKISSFERQVKVVKVLGLISIAAWFYQFYTLGLRVVFISDGAGPTDLGKSTLLQIIHLMRELRYPYMAAFVLLSLRKNTDTFLKAIFVIISIQLVLDTVTLGSKGVLVNALVAGTVALLVGRVVFELKHYFYGLIVLATIWLSFLVITEYRQIIIGNYFNKSSSLNITVQLDAASNALSNVALKLTNGRNENARLATEDLFSRLGASTQGFSNLLSQTKRISPMEYPLGTILVPVHALIPRSVFPNKPIFFGSGRNASEYYGKTFGGISVTLPGSFYYNLGYPGIIVGMFFVGAFVSVLNKKCNNSNGTILPLVILTSAVVQLADVGTTFQDMATNLVRLMVLIKILEYFVSLKMNKRMA